MLCVVTPSDKDVVNVDASVGNASENTLNRPLEYCWSGCNSKRGSVVAEQALLGVDDHQLPGFLV